MNVDNERVSNVAQNLLYSKNRLKGLLSDVVFEEIEASKSDVNTWNELIRQIEVLEKRYTNGMPHVKVAFTEADKQIYLNILESVQKFIEAYSN